MKNATIIAMTMATFLTTGLMAGNASAAECKTFSVKASGSSVGAIAKFCKRRAERWAKSSWETFVAKQYGSRFANVDVTKNVRMSCGLNSRGNT